MFTNLITYLLIQVFLNSTIANFFSKYNIKYMYLAKIVNFLVIKKLFNTYMPDTLIFLK